ncbi:MAG: histidine phosphatase family protein [Phycisphaerae bacterium]|nr:histidine phosphatase family protein [Phycisphaerae bacterium]
MLLILIRHAKAFDRDAAAWPDDLRRPLTASGRESFAKLAKRLGRIAPVRAGKDAPVDGVERVLASPASRAWQTAQVLHERSGWPAPERCAALLPDCDELSEWQALIDSLRDAAGVALVGHEPGLGRLASWLLSGSKDQVRIDLRKGAAVAVEIARGPGAVQPRARLRWMLTPRIAARWK